MNIFYQFSGKQYFSEKLISGGKIVKVIFSWG